MENSTGNVTFVVSTPSVSIPAVTPQTDFSNIHRLYIGVGTGAIVTNIVVFAVLLSDKAYFRQSPMLFGLTSGNMLNGLGHTMIGAYRLILTIQGHNTDPITAWQCALTGIQLVLLMGSHTPAIMLIAASTERLVALASPHFYRNSWTSRRSWQLVAVLFCVALICVFGSWIAAGVTMAGVTLTRTCTTPLYVGKAYAAYLYAVPFFGGSLGSIFSLTALIIGYTKLRKVSVNSDSKKRLQKQIRLTTTLFAIAISDFIMVAIPNLFLFLDNAVGITPPIGSAESSSMYCCNSLLLLLSCLILNGEFRMRATTLFRLSRLVHGHSSVEVVVPSNNLAPSDNKIYVTPASVNAVSK